ncbi:response regulator transcription factor [Jatrophihabitans cynanchi]|uniref:Response regulator transcription factor n=1 Tax=Jatrophihabitans cynanchi TaxID=2944128 RepID=A0ABY7JXZ1_9ACTN|nr:response regulator transcription factor [Jatrophihabitans sp. SB3-54]WAX56039.1 response regulator transcription factor [Jatrophihabitans sp. SB3-54]
MPRVAIVEDHLLLAETLHAALARTGVDAVLIAPREPDALLSALLQAQPDLVLLDLDLDGFGESTPLIAPLAEAGVRVLVITGSNDRLRIAAALEQGALGYQSKAAGFNALLHKTALALTAIAPLDAEHRVELLDELTRSRAARERDLAPYATLTAREADTLRALARGWSVADIAANWVVSENTVRSHVRGVLAKLGAPSQLAAVADAVRTGWFVG